MTNTHFKACTIDGGSIITAAGTQFEKSTLSHTTFVVSVKQCNFAGSSLYDLDFSQAQLKNCDFREAHFSAEQPVKLGDTTGSNFLHATCNSTAMRSSLTTSGERSLLTYHRASPRHPSANATFFPCHGGQTTPLLTDGCVTSSGNFSDNKGMPCEAAVPLLV